MTKVRPAVLELNLPVKAVFDYIKCNGSQVVRVWDLLVAVLKPCSSASCKYLLWSV